MKYNVIKNGEVVKKNLSKKQAEDYCEKMNEKFMDSQEKVQKEKVKSGLPLKKSKYELYKVEVVKENVIRLTESDLVRLVKMVINESEEKTIKLTMSQKMKLLKSGLKPDYRLSGDLLIIVGVTQKRGSAIATIRKDEDKIVLTYRGEKKEFENISDCIDYFLDDRNSNKNSK
jgi:hypothetical protein